MAKTAKSKIESLSPSGHVSLRWKDSEGHVGTEWLSTTTPKDERAPARIRMSSRNSDGSYSYFCYRDASAVAVVHTLDDAKRKCEIGKQAKASDKVLQYVEEHAGEIPWWLKLTEAERRAIRAQYGYAAPPASRVQRVLDSLGKKGGRSGGPNLDDPGTRKLLEEMAAKESAGASRASTGAVAPKPKVAALEAAEGKLTRLKEGNPKKPGTGAHKRWEALFAACGKPASAYRAAGGNLETLANAITKGYVKIEEGK